MKDGKKMAYIAGQLYDAPDLLPKFAKARKCVREMGYEVLDPPSDQAVTTLLEQADMVFFIPGFDWLPGVETEKELCREMNIPTAVLAIKK